MSPRTTGVLLLLAAALGAFVYFHELEGEGARQEAEERTRRLFDVAAENIAWIELDSEDGVSARFERREDDWWLVDPVEHPADEAVGRMAEALAGITHEARFESPGPPEEYGLDDATARVVRFGASEGEHALRLGAETPVGSDLYARADDDPEVLTVPAHHRTTFTRTLADLREKRILDFDVASIRGLEASWPDGRVVLEREATDEQAAEGESAWRMTAPLAAEGDDSAIAGLLSTLAFLRADDFLDAPSDAERALFDPPAWKATLRGAESDVATIAVGRVGPDDRHPVRAGDGPLYWIGSDRVESFPRDPAAYRDRRVAGFAVGDARQLDFFFQSERGDPLAVHARRDEGGWTSEPDAVAEGKLGRVASELSRLEAETILAESMGEAELEAVGLSPPRTILTVFGARPEAPEGGDELPPEAPVLAEVHFGEVSADGIVARNAERDTIYRIAIEAAENLPVSLDAFENRFRAAPESEPAPPPFDLPGPGDELVQPAEESP